MKTLTKFAVATVATVLFSSGGAFAGDSVWHAVDTHHGSFIYMSRPVQQEQPTFAFGGHAKASTSRQNGQFTERAASSVERQGVRLHQVSTPHGTVSYFAPVE